MQRSHQFAALWWRVLVLATLLVAGGCGKSQPVLGQPQEAAAASDRHDTLRSSESDGRRPDGAVQLDPSPVEPNDTGSIEEVAFNSRQGGPSDVLFESLDPKQAGIDFHHQWTRRPGQLRKNTTGSGVAMGDYDGDGRVDVFLPRSTDAGRLYRNLGGFHFEDVTERVGIRGDGRWTTGATFVDVDNDGDLDLYVCGFDCANHLYQNNGDGTFTECGQKRGLGYDGSSVMMAFGDYDRDGDLDGYLVTNHVPPDEEIEYRPEIDRQGVPRVPQKYREYHDTIRLPDGSYGFIEVGQYDHLYKNDGHGIFTDVSKAAGIGGNYKGLAATWWDYNNDGWPDLYVANDFYGPDHLYRNNRDGTFTDVASVTLPHTPWFSMGCDLGDVNNDGLIDLTGTDMASDTHYRANVTLSHIEEERWFLESPVPRQYMRNALYLATGTQRVLETAFLCGLEATNWTWSVRWEDLDQDGRVDAFFTNGMSLDETNNDLKAEALKTGPVDSQAYINFWEKQGPLRERNLAFRNQGELRFENVSRQWGLDYLGVSFGAAFGDLDGDGDLDLVVNNFNDTVSVYRNTGTAGRAIRLRLVGTRSNIWGIGATVRAYVGQTLLARSLTLSRGFMSASDPTVHLGLGEAEVVDRLVIEWPSGLTQEITNLPADRFYTITEQFEEPGAGSQGAEVSEISANAKTQTRILNTPLFVKSESSAAVTHREKLYDDLTRQPLLSWRHSQLGPGMSVGDVDGNGYEDLFVGGAAKNSGTLLLHYGGGEWMHSPELFPIWNDDSASEDLGTLLLDIDGDGDLDLYVVSGGVECEPGDELLRDRLYLNEDRGRFVRASADRLPDLRDSGSVAAAADYDRDGDLDLFVGGRLIPGRFPETPHSRLLNNHKGSFHDSTMDDGPQLPETGLVTAALWTDANGDGWIDLLLTHEWGPIKLFLNHQGQLRDATVEAGLADCLGWWNGIAGRDLDGDGDIDYVATNLGRNTAYRVSRERPARLFYGNFDDTGEMRVLEARYDERGRLVPALPKPIVQEVLAFVTVDFPKYHEYASATLAEIVGQGALDESLQLTANTADSVLLRNDGRGAFTLEPLPMLAQIAPGYGVVMTDLDADGYTDAYLVQNSYAPRGEVGHFDGGVSVLLLGNDRGQLSAVPPAESGLVVPGDAKSVVTTDLNGDAWPDLVVGMNDGPTLAFEHQGVENRRLATLRLRGRAGNPTAVGARVTVVRDDGVRQTAEVYAGGGYLSQPSAALHFGLGATAQTTSVEVRWPDGTTSRHPLRLAQSVEVITQPEH